MKKAQFFHNLTKYAWKVICQQFWLLAVLSMLFLALPLFAGPVAEGILTDGVGFSGMTLAVCTPEGDSTGELLEQLTGNMRDISRYATFRSMEWEAAAKALEEGEVTAVLVLPENFVGGVLNGSNPDVTLIVAGDRPLESLLTLWVGQSAADLLTSAQRGIYAVLELYPGESVSGLSWDQVKTQINMDYITRTLNRQELFRVTELKATGTMEMPLHYGLSLLIFLCMALPPLFCPLFSEEHMSFRRRLRSLGHGAATQLGSCLWVIFWAVFAMTLLPVLFLTGGNLAGGAMLALFAGAYGSFCCLLTRSSAGCGAVAFPVAALAVFLSGGIVPTPLLPEAVRILGSISPVGMLRQLLYLSAAEWGDAPWALPGVLLWTAGLLAAGVLLYRRRLEAKEGSV